jgi:hypothetical protein
MRHVFHAGIGFLLGIAGGFLLCGAASLLAGTPTMHHTRGGVWHADEFGAGDVLIFRDPHAVERLEKKLAAEQARTRELEAEIERLRAERPAGESAAPGK